MTPRTLAGRYELSSKIGSGGMGTVWRGRDKLLDRDVAVKILHEGLASDAVFAERFRREAVSAASLAHPNVVAVYDTGEEDGIPYIVMECHEGESLHARLAREGALPAEDTARIARSILAALGHAHSRGLVHRDMKPANVLLDPETLHAKVVDFGIAKGIEDTGGGLTRTSGLIGTAAYFSPEQVSGQHATQASDLYAVGCLMYACLTGDPPFGGGSPVAVAMSHVRDPVQPLRARRPDVSPDLEAVVMRALEKDPARRFSSAQEMDTAIVATGLDRRQSTEPTLYAAPAEVAAAPTVAAGGYVAGPARAGTEVIERPAKQQGPGALAALTAFLIAAAIAALAVLYLQNRNQDNPLEAPLPTVTVTLTPATPEPTPSPTESPPQDNDDDDDEGGGGFPLDLPGFGGNN